MKMHTSPSIRLLALQTLLFGCLMAAPLSGSAQEAASSPEPKAFDPDHSFWALTLDGFFPAGQKSNKPKSTNLNVYLVRRGGEWISGVGTATDKGRPTWNTSLMLVDPSGATVQEGKLTGTIQVTLVPDPWIPKDQKARVATVTVDGKFEPNPAGDPPAKLEGTWEVTIPGDAAELEEAGLQPKGSGALTAGLAAAGVPDVADLSYDLNLSGLIPGTTGNSFHQRRALSLGVKEGQFVSARLGQVDMRQNVFDYESIELPESGEVQPNTMSAQVKFSADTLDGEAAQFAITVKGGRVADWIAGTWEGTYTLEGQEPKPITGFLRGNVKKGATLPEVAEQDDRPWFVEVKNFKPVQPGEHPRLFFRKDDLPELRRRAETPEGQKIIARLRQLLNGSDGKSMPSLYTPATMAYDKSPEAVAFKKGLKKEAPEGVYTFTHGAGYGFLYQLTGDKLYADLARECVEKAWAGQRNNDDRYAWVAPGGELRAGPTIGWYAVAYDLCYDAWEPAFRTKVAQAIQDYSDVKGGEWNKAEGITLRSMILTPKQGPGSNHFGAVVGGTGLAVLAIKGDPGTDNELLDKYAEVIERQAVRHFMGGWGDGGYYKEGWGASRVGTRYGFLSFLQALKNAAGHDYMNTERTSVSYMTMVPRCLMVLGPPPVIPYRSNMGSTYGGPEIGTDDGFFSEGFGAIADKHKAGLLWTWNHVFNPKGTEVYDTGSSYPHRAMLALINWPTFEGITEKNPAEVMPLATRDHDYDYFVFRNRFQDKDDIVTTLLINLPEATKPREVMVWGLGGLRLTFGEPAKMAKVTHYAPTKDGSATLTAGSYTLAVDYSGASGADALFVSIGGNAVKPPAPGERVKVSTVTLGDRTLNVMTLSAKGQHPEPKVEGDQLIIGGQAITWGDGHLILAKAAPPL